MQHIENPSMMEQAATTSTQGPSFFARHSKTTRWSHSPTVYAMIHGSRMDNCKDIQAILSECHATKSKDAICRTAEMYLSSCMQR